MNRVNSAIQRARDAVGRAASKHVEDGLQPAAAAEAAMKTCADELSTLEATVRHTCKVVAAIEPDAQKGPEAWFALLLSDLRLHALYIAEHQRAPADPQN